MDITTSEFFKNLTSLPDEGTQEFEDLIKWEEEKCLGGVNVNGIKIPGWLYFNLNHWWIRGDKKDNYGNIVRVPIRPYLRDNEWIRSEAMEACRTQMKGYMEIGLRQGGKDLLDSSKLYTPDGEITIGECNIGDQIYDESVKLTTIIAKFPQGIKPVYELTLYDNRKIYCGLDHNWFVYDRHKKVYKKLTTRELLKDYRYERPSWKAQGRKNPYEFKYYIDSNKPVEYSEKDLEIPPYLMGLWLGDGGNYQSNITTADKEIYEYVKDYCDSQNLTFNKLAGSEYTYLISSGKKGGSVKENITNREV